VHIFYLGNADVTISHTSTPGTYQVRFFGEPARTDRSARVFGSLRGRGTWVMAAESRLDLNVELERSGIDEIATLIRGDAVGVHGAVASRVHISGPVSRLNIQGRFRWKMCTAGT